MNGSFMLLLTATLIVFGVLAVAAYAIKQFTQHPARVAGVLLAFATLVGALPPLLSELASAAGSVSTAPPHPATSASTVPMLPSSPATAGGGRP